jgi:hypothetical protein
MLLDPIRLLLFGEFRRVNPFNPPFLTVLGMVGPLNRAVTYYLEVFVT